MTEIEELKAQIKQYEANERDLMMSIVLLNEAYREKLIPETKEQEQALHHSMEVMQRVLNFRDKY